MEIHTGDAITFTGVAYLDLSLTTPVNFANYQGSTFSIVDWLTFSTYSAVPNVGTAAGGTYTVAYLSGVLTQRGSYYYNLVGTYGATVQTTFYLAPNGQAPYLEID